MKLGELVDILKALDTFESDAEIVIQRQPEWPIISQIRGVVHTPEGQVCLIAGDDIGYGSKELYRQLENQAESSGGW